MSAQQSGSSIHDSARSVACPICQAVYAPSRWHEHLLPTSSMALESAFMGMCHFCFRCRRPSCPECWDDVHGICAECGQESQLPFRRATAPLSPLLFTASRHAQLERERPNSAPLACISTGKFHSAHSLPIEGTVTAAIETVAKESKGREKREIATEIVERKTRPERKGGFERIALLMLCMVVGIVIVLVVVASMSEDANTFIASTLHVDIHAEIAYLWQLITHLFS